VGNPGEKVWVGSTTRILPASRSAAKAASELVVVCLVSTGGAHEGAALTDYRASGVSRINPVLRERLEGHRRQREVGYSQRSREFEFGSCCTTMVRC
jgi:hypothetical protein